MPVIIDNKVIKTSIVDIVNNLKSILIVNHINKLRDIYVKNNNLVITCPCHKQGQENKPSCSILLEDKKIIRNNKQIVINAGTVSCFTCGYKANLIGFVATCLSISYIKAKEWILNSSNFDLIELERPINFIESTDTYSNNYNDLPIITNDELDSYRQLNDYMFKRKLSLDIIKKFDVGYDKNTDALTFPVYVNNNCLFVAKRYIKYKRFQMPAINPKPIYGLDYIDPSQSVIVCESIINALTAWTYKKQAIALFGTGSDYQLDILSRCGIRHFILMYDGDLAGRHGAEKFKQKVKNSFITDIILNPGMDVNDLSEEEFNKLLNNNRGIL